MQNISFSWILINSNFSIISIIISLNYFPLLLLSYSKKYHIRLNILHIFGIFHYKIFDSFNDSALYCNLKMLYLYVDDRRNFVSKDFLWYFVLLLKLYFLYLFLYFLVYINMLRTVICLLYDFLGLLGYSFFIFFFN